MRKHWLYAMVDKYNIELTEETQCGDCIHVPVCSQDMEKLCSNYCFGTSEHRGCLGCIHRYARWDDRQALPCFHCKHFLDNPKARECRDTAWNEDIANRKKRFLDGVAESDRLLAEAKKK